MIRQYAQRRITTAVLGTLFALGAAAPSDGTHIVLQPPADWREASLFVARDDNRRPVANRQPNGMQPSVPAQDDNAAGLQTAPIFLARREGDGAQ